MLKVVVLAGHYNSNKMKIFSVVRTKSHGELLLLSIKQQHKQQLTAHQRCTLHDGLFPPIWHGHTQLREVHQHFSHFIAPLTTAHIDDTITVTVLGQGLGNDSLATAKSSRNGTSACTVAKQSANNFSTGTRGSTTHAVFYDSCSATAQRC